MRRAETRRAVVSMVFLALIGFAGCGGDAGADESLESRGSDDVAAAAVPPGSEEGSGPSEVAEEPATLNEAFGVLGLTVFERIWTESRLAPELGDEEITLLVPNNAAFASASEGSVAGEAKARSFVLRHAAEGRYDRAALATMTELDRKEGPTLTVRSGPDGLHVGQAEVLRSLKVGEATIHVVSRLLISQH